VKEEWGPPNQSYPVTVLRNRVTVEIGPGQKKDVVVRLMPVRTMPGLCGGFVDFAGPPIIDQRKTESGATIPDTMFQNIPLGPPPDR